MSYKLDKITFIMIEAYHDHTMTVLVDGEYETVPEWN